MVEKSAKNWKFWKKSAEHTHTNEQAKMLEKCLKKTEERRTIGSNPKQGKIHTNETGDLAQVAS